MPTNGDPSLACCNNGEVVQAESHDSDVTTGGQTDLRSINRIIAMWMNASEEAGRRS